MDGLKVKDITLFLGKLPTRKQSCFYFTEGAICIPVAYISKKNLPEAERLWGAMLKCLPLE
ncbi:hypothetical protein LCGC14_2096220, partial [marine sediment metagenome]